MVSFRFSLSFLGRAGAALLHLRGNPNRLIGLSFFLGQPFSLGPLRFARPNRPRWASQTGCAGEVLPGRCRAPGKSPGWRGGNGLLTQRSYRGCSLDQQLGPQPISAPTASQPGFWLQRREFPTLAETCQGWEALVDPPCD